MKADFPLDSSSSVSAGVRPEDQTLGGRADTQPLQLWQLALINYSSFNKINYKKVQRNWKTSLFFKIIVYCNELGHFSYAMESQEKHTLTNRGH